MYWHVRPYLYSVLYLYGSDVARTARALDAGATAPASTGGGARRALARARCPASPPAGGVLSSVAARDRRRRYPWS